MSVLVLERRGAVAEIRLNRPDRHNALDRELKSRLVEELSAVAVDATVRAVLLSAEGRSFCVGQDLGDLQRVLAEDPEGAADTVMDHFNPITRALATMPKPVVAAVQGTCAGAGLGFALACDLQVWAAGVTLTTAFSGVALTCDSGLSASLARAVGVPRAAELILLNESFTPEQASQWGMPGRIVAPDEVLDVARDLVEQLAAGPTAAYAASKRLLSTSPAASWDDVLAAEAEEQRACGASNDHREAVAAFLERRRPVYTGA